MEAPLTRELADRISSWSSLKVAVIHYWFITRRGGEKVVESILRLFPQADVYTLFFDPGTYGPHLDGHRVFSSVLDKPLLRRHHQKVFPLYPTGIRSLRLRGDYDLILSSESGPAKGVENPNRIPHLCYIHTPMRYCWGFSDSYLENLPFAARRPARRLLHRLRKWDETTVDGVDLYVANSLNVANRVREFYHRPAEVCHPPIDLDLFAGKLCRRPQDYYLSFGAITPYKNIELLVKTFNRSGRPLVIVGEGSERKRLEMQAAGNIRFTGPLPMDQVLTLADRARALIFPGEEDFGMVPLEMMARGLPVIALRRGGALESVMENTSDPSRASGLFFNEDSCESLLDAIDRYEVVAGQMDPEWIRRHARGFGEDVFLQRFAGFVEQVLKSAGR